MDSQSTLIIAAAVALVVIAVGLWFFYGRQRQARLRERFGPEYERTVAAVGSPTKADAVLRERLDRVERFKIGLLTREQVEAFAREWRRVQALFVDSPDGAVTEADRLLTQVMTARGYPLEDFDQRAEDISVDHPHVVQNYRTARLLVVRRQRGEAGTEELRQAIVNYRALFDDLLEIEGDHHRRAS